MTPDNLHDLYLHQLRDLYSAESQIIDALPTMIDQTTHPELRQAFETHLDETRRHKQRLEQLFERMDEKPTGEKCKGMEGLIKEAKSDLSDTHSFFGDDSPGAVRDAALIAQAQRIEHYEIAGYGTVCTYAEQLGRTQDVTFLKQTLEEEKQTDAKLTRLAEQVVNPEAMTA